MPLVLKTLKTFFLAKTRYRCYCIHTSIPHAPDTLLRYACDSIWLRTPPPPAKLPIPPPPLLSGDDHAPVTRGRM